MSTGASILTKQQLPSLALLKRYMPEAVASPHGVTR